MTRADWIAVDWGATHLRAYAMGPEGVRAEAGSDRGTGKLAPEDHEPALLALVERWLTPGRATPVLACGMVGARQGWTEAPYRAVPCTPLDPASLIRVPTQDTRLDLRLVPGLSQARPPDVMRGDETRIAGALALHKSFDGVILLPGAQSRWVQVSAGEVVSFQTFMTGELFALLSTQSVLRHGIAVEGWDEAAFAGGLSDAISRPERIAARLFALRAEALLTGLSPVAARSRLSGLLIGIELAAAKPYWLGQDLVLVGAEALAVHYGAALAAQGVTARSLPASACTIAGLATARPRPETA